MNYFKTYIGRKIISSKFFWRIRHLIQPSWLQSYSNVPKVFLNELIIKNNYKSVLDFGCATGSLLYGLKCKDENFLCYGIDISKEAIKSCNLRFNKLSLNKKTFKFECELNDGNLKSFLENNNILLFDVVIFDRVLYCLSEKELNSILNIATRFAKNIFIDDFMFEKKINSIVYKHRDWIKILGGYNFKCLINKQTIYNKVKNANARSLLFENNSNN